MKIESGIPIPRPLAKRSGLMPFLKQMQIGDSILIGPYSANAANNVHGVARNAGIKVTARKTPEGLRVWRIA